MSAYVAYFDRCSPFTPSGFTCAADIQASCTMVGTPGQVIAGYSFDLECASLPAIATVANTYDPTEGPIASARRLVLIGGSAPTEGAARASSKTGLHTQFSGNNSLDNPGNDAGGGGLATSTKVGIAVAVPLAVIFLTAALLLVLRARRKRSQRHTESGGGMAAGPGLAPGFKRSWREAEGLLLQGRRALHIIPASRNSRTRSSTSLTLLQGLIGRRNCMAAGTPSTGARSS
jgi:hypothetical protein